MKFELKKHLVIGENDIKEIELKDDDFTAGVILDAEQKFLRDGGVYPVDEIQSSRKYLAYVLSEMTNIQYEEIIKLSMSDFIKITDYIKGFFGNSVYSKMLELLSEK
ncbi:hypothetical protein IX317_001841 [Fusobacterium sp. DD29]|uniref:hypothetical protein n=1 Tax=unclassified Fusobacterium TaxID=2648384 RepID=UPI001B8AC2D1|nr:MULTISPECIES: hypothetical protein [unclassified Fusobacterium]MBR8701161.1 hypothetical protein [Fusobacterium sp. DD45]MBR8711326.1 hypothetical protein [Fusobacterium sp. DD28]MBR8750157.1 hypothetical protein [Fusobacterium sp. DD29]MBR8751875.1 hypothetical protein [Fusobacterium sp. DD26]MBR8762399.1 hypothetical protein [Fusobacterium sp. DD25]